MIAAAVLDKINASLRCATILVIMRRVCANEIQSRLRNSGLLRFARKDGITSAACR